MFSLSSGSFSKIDLAVLRPSVLRFDFRMVGGHTNPTESEFPRVSRTVSRSHLHKQVHQHGMSESCDGSRTVHAERIQIVKKPTFLRTNYDLCQSEHFQRRNQYGYNLTGQQNSLESCAQALNSHHRVTKCCLHNVAFADTTCCMRRSNFLLGYCTRDAWLVHRVGCSRRSGFQPDAARATARTLLPSF